MTDPEDSYVAPVQLCNPWFVAPAEPKAAAGDQAPGASSNYTGQNVSQGPQGAAAFVRGASGGPVTLEGVSESHVESEAAEECRRLLAAAQNERRSAVFKGEATAIMKSAGETFAVFSESARTAAQNFWNSDGLKN